MPDPRVTGEHSLEGQKTVLFQGSDWIPSVLGHVSLLDTVAGSGTDVDGQEGHCEVQHTGQVLIAKLGLQTGDYTGDNTQEETDQHIVVPQ